KNPKNHVLQKRAIKEPAGPEELTPSEEERELAMVADGGVCVAYRPAEPLYKPGVQLNMCTPDGGMVPVNLTESEEEFGKLFVQDLLRKLQALAGNPAQISPETTLVFKGEKLEPNSKPLGEYGLKSKSSIQMVVKVHGG
ncbi:hypothetical protein OJAV_G00181050, partial [Oryzias javanicus]